MDCCLNIKLFDNKNGKMPSDFMQSSSCCHSLNHLCSAAYFEQLMRIWIKTTTTCVIIQCVCLLTTNCSKQNPLQRYFFLCLKIVIICHSWGWRCQRWYFCQVFVQTVWSGSSNLGPSQTSQSECGRHFSHSALSPRYTWGCPPAIPTTFGAPQILSGL